MSRTVDTKEYLDAICELLEQGKENLSVPVSGNSMIPFLRPGDTVYLSLAKKPLKPGDICLFCRLDGSYVLHRLFRKDTGGRLWMLGDNQRILEPVLPCQVRAVVTGVIRRGKKLSQRDFLWWCYAYPWRWLWRSRRSISALREKLRQ